MGNLIECRKHECLFLPKWPCSECVREKEILDHIFNIEGRFYAWTLSEPQEEDFSWLVRTLKGIIKNGSI